MKKDKSKASCIEAENPWGVLDKWLSEYPEKDISSLKGQLKEEHSQIDAYFELLIFALLKRLGFSVDIHPDIIDGPKRPDFMAYKKGIQLIAEVKVDHNKKGKEVIKKERQIQGLKQVIMGIRNYGYGIHVKEFKVTAPKGIEPLIKSFANQLEEALKNMRKLALEGNAVSKEFIEKVRVYDKDGIFIEYSLFPLSNENSNEGTMPIIDTSLEGGFVSYPKTLMQAVKSKSHRYEVKDYPYLICVYEMNILVDEQSILQTMLGTGCFEEYSGEGDGFFANGKHRGVSAVIIIGRGQGHLSNLRYWLFINEEARNPLPLVDLPLAYYCVGPVNCSYKPEEASLWDILDGTELGR